MDFMLHVVEEALDDYVVVGRAWPSHAQCYFWLSPLSPLSHGIAGFGTGVMKGRPRSGRVATQRHFKRMYRRGKRGRVHFPELRAAAEIRVAQVG